MDNTRVMDCHANGTPYDKMFKVSNGKASQKTASSVGTPISNHHYDHRNGITNTGGMYTIGSGNGKARILMNTPSIASATNLQFLPPTRNKSTMIPILKAIKVSTSQSAYVPSSCEPASMSKSDVIKPTIMIEPQMGPEIFVTRPLSVAFIQNRLPIARKMITTERTVFVKRTSGPIIQENPKYSNENCNNHIQTTSGEPNSLVNAIKNCVFNYLIKPIIDKTTMLVGTDNNGKSTTNSAAWNQHDMNATAGGSPVNHNHNNKSEHGQYSDCNRSNDRFSFHCEKSDYFLNYMPEKFFDCDDYIDGGEDTIDFVADSTNIQYNHFDTELDNGIEQPSPKDHVFYDCVNKFEVPASTDDVTVEKLQQKVANANECLDVVSTTENDTMVDAIAEPVQCSEEEKSSMNCPKYEKPNRKSYRRKRGKRKQQQQQKQRQKKHHSKSNNRVAKANGQKNRHEKIRHEVEQNIHDDIDDCSVVKDFIAYEPDDDDDIDDDDDVDLEIIDVDDDNLPKSPASCSSANAAVATKSTSVCIETPIPSPEAIKSGCIFTQFFRFDNSNWKQKSSLPLRCQQKQVPQSKSPRDRSAECRRTSETSESDDSFIVFEESSSSPKATTTTDDLMSKSNVLNRRQRQMSECSDDFILFEDDTDDVCRRYDTTDEDFTDSTDDSDDSDDESGDESDCSVCSSISQQKHDGESNQPDSGFEEKKVTFNLCPTVHEIRAWKFAYSQARKGKWEQMGRDRERFEKRINGLDRILSPILAPAHRQKIYEQRFQSDD